MQLITVSSVKGGVSKTGLVSGLAQAFSYLNYDVLTIDLDPNNNLTDYFLRKHDPKLIWRSNIFHFLTKKKSIEECIYQSIFTDIIPSTIELQKVSLALSGDPGSLLRVRSSLKKLSYDIILIDTPPYLGYEIRAGLYAADIVVTPLAPVRWNIQALAILKEELKLVSETTGRIPNLLCVPSMVTKSGLNKLKGYKTLNLTKSWIAQSPAVYNAQKKGAQINKNSNSWTQFINLAKEIIACPPPQKKKK